MKWLLIPMAVLTSAPAIAQDFDPRDPITGNGILSICSQEDPVSRTACGLYVRGMNHLLNTMQVHGQIQRIECSPGASTSNQKRDVFIAYLKANPRSRHLGSPLLFMRAMAEAFPCPPAQGMTPPDRRL